MVYELGHNGDLARLHTLILTAADSDCQEDCDEGETTTDGDDDDPHLCVIIISLDLLGLRSLYNCYLTDSCVVSIGARAAGRGASRRRATSICV